MAEAAIGTGLLKRGKGRGKRNFDTSINITPLIDLFASTLCFLLVSATYVQNAKLDANLPSAGGAASASIAQEEPEEKLELQLLLAKGGKIMVDRGNGLEEIAPEGETFNWVKFDEILKEVRGNHPNHEDATLSADPDVDYEHVIAAMDICIANRLSNVSLAASAVKPKGG